MGVTHVQKFVRVWPSNAGEVDAYHQEVGAVTLSGLSTSVFAPFLVA